MPSLAQVLARPSAFSSAGERSSRLLGGDMPPQNPNFAVTGIAHLQGESICRAPQRARPFAPVTEFPKRWSRELRLGEQRIGDHPSGSTSDPCPEDFLPPCCSLLLSRSERQSLSEP